MVGTAIQVQPRPAYRHLCDAHRLPGLLRQYGDFLQFPILWEGSQVNSMSPPWHQPAATVSDYAVFLRNRDPQMPAPLLVMPVFIQRGAIEIRGVLWVPGRRLSLSDSDLGTVDLYWRRVLHESGRADVLPRQGPESNRIVQLRFSKSPGRHRPRHPFPLSTRTHAPAQGEACSGLPRVQHRPGAGLHSESGVAQHTAGSVLPVAPPVPKDFENSGHLPRFIDGYIRGLTIPPIARPQLGNR
jgi:hypothetical protein